MAQGPHRWRKWDCFMQHKLDHVETLRGMACLALVMFHVVGTVPEGGMRLAEGHYLTAVVEMLGDLRMPLFSFISGFVFLPMIRNGADLLARIAKKARRLLIPLGTVGSLFWASQAGLGMEVPGYLEIFYLPYAHFWYLKATFLMMAAFYALTYAVGNRDIAVAVALLLLGAGVWVFTPGWTPNVFSTYNAVFLAPFFMAGYLCARPDGLAGLFGRIGDARALGPVAIGLGTGLIGLEYALGPGGVELGSTLRKAVTVAVGLSGCLLLFAWRPVWRPLVLIGTWSYAIFLFHVFFTAATRMVLVRVYPDLPVLLDFALGMTAGLLGPILLAQVLLRRRWTALAFLGILRRPERSWRAGAPARSV